MVVFSRSVDSTQVGKLWSSGEMMTSTNLGLIFYILILLITYVLTIETCLCLLYIYLYGFMIPFCKLMLVSCSELQKKK